MWRWLLVLAVTATACGDDSAARQVVVIGDSNVTQREPIIRKLLNPAEIHARRGAAILPGTSSTIDWAAELQGIDADVVVVNLGINDAALPGTADGQGYRSYGDKIDWFLGLLPEGVPVLWTNLPCDLEPKEWQEGCRAVNRALTEKARQWENLTVVPWAEVARPEHFRAPGLDVHLNPLGGRAWAETVDRALDQVQRS